jgi:ubiquinone/menaquinone biosynthesis C-methylase UbiE
MNDSKFSTWEDAVSWLISQPEQQEIVQACYYDTPLKAAADRYWQSSEWQAIREFFPPCQDKALDIGAGNGIASYALAKDGWQVEALEPDASNLVGVGAIRQLANECNLSINTVQEFGEQLPFADNCFNLVFARQVLHHAQDLSQLCREIYRVLKPGGIFIAVRDHVIASKADLPKFLETHPLHQLYGGENAYLRSEYIEAIESANLKVKQILDAFDSPINYSPHTQATLKQELSTRLHSLPAAGLTDKILLNNAIFPHILKLLSKLDRRPGRAVSFICYKNSSER